MGQKTLQKKPTAFDRINVRRLFLALERSTQRTLKYFVFEPNTEATRTRLYNAIEPIFAYAKQTEGLYDFLIVCDDRNNTPESIDNNELIVDIYIKPVRTAEFILVNFIATRTGQDFSELL
jgi:phage tail sheath protein FI